MKRRRSLIVFLYMLAFLISACSQSAPAAQAGKAEGESEEVFTPAIPDEPYEAVEYSLYPSPEGGYVGDVMPYVTEEGELELYYLYDTDVNGQGYHPIYKYSTQGLVGFKDHGMVLNYGLMSDPDPALGTGSVMQDRKSGG
jgi:beta-fructofuranosidase